MYRPGECPVGIFCDFSRAFDCIDRDILIERLYSYGIGGLPLNWIASFIKVRRQYVSLTYTSQNNVEEIKSEISFLKMGVPQIVEIDHKPLVALFKKPLNKVPARLQRMLLNLQPYNLEVLYKPGKQLYIADTLSRSYCKNDNSDTIDKEIKIKVNLLIDNLLITKTNQILFSSETIKILY